MQPLVDISEALQTMLSKGFMFRLYSQLEEVKQKKEEEDRKAFYAQNREKRRDYEKVW